MVCAYPVYLALTHRRPRGKVRPGGDGFAHLFQDLRRGADAKAVGDRQQIGTVIASNFPLTDIKC